MSDKIIIFDTTLRDGEQSPGATMNQREKVRMARQLDALGVDVIEAGFPAASQGDFEAVQAIAAAAPNCQIAGLCRAIPADIDRAWEAVKGAKHPRIHTFLATSPLHMEHKLRMSPDKVLEMAVAAVKRAASYTANVEFSAEDASRSERGFLAKVFSAVIKAGATTVNVPDTVGYAQPGEFGELIAWLLEHVEDSHKAVFSVHCHNDLGLGVANTLAALKAGARQAEVTVSGIGERAGNASLEELVMNLYTRQSYYDLDCGVRTEQLFPTCRLLSMIIGQPIPPYKAITGANAFAHESGIHQDGVLKDRRTYEIMTPESVGRTETELVLGKHSGRHALGKKLESLNYRLDEKQVAVVFEAVKELADKKAKVYDEDLEALVLEKVYKMDDCYRLKSLSVLCGDHGVPPTAAVVMNVCALEEGAREVKQAAFGNGPVDAIFNAVNAIVGRTPVLKRYSVNAITGGSDAQGEVTVRIEDKGLSSVGRGSHPDIVFASALAYLTALNRLVRKEEEGA
ncbi:MAG: 2-isopropylmalate synthase [Desulfovibrionaceae bacterium]|jgi:2-isopropylmalate synthase|nr:2-isopropylmalate synthase [Desulfovibrionaceae bacterium]